MALAFARARARTTCAGRLCRHARARLAGGLSLTKSADRLAGAANPPLIERPHRKTGKSRRRARLGPELLFKRGDPPLLIGNDLPATAGVKVCRMGASPGGLVACAALTSSHFTPLKRILTRPRALAYT